MRLIALLALVATFGSLLLAWVSSTAPARTADAQRTTDETPEARGPGRSLGELAEDRESSDGSSAVRQPAESVVAGPPGGPVEGQGNGASARPLGPPDELPVDAPPQQLVAISGMLRHESGAFSRTASEVLATVHLDIIRCERSTEDAEERLPGPQLVPVQDQDGHLEAVAFTFNGLRPDQPYEITLSTVDHQRWSGPSIRGYAPNQGVEFVCFGEDRSVPLGFIVTDAATGEAIEGDWTASEVRITSSRENGVLVHAAPLSLGEIPVDAELDFVIEADGYRPAFGDRSAFDRDPATGALTARVALERGFAARLIVLGRDPRRVLAGGADVWLDGVSAGRTNAAGSLLITGRSAPEQIEVQWRGQRLSGPFEEVLLTRRSVLRIALLEER